MNRHQQLRLDMQDEDKIVSHDLRVTAVDVDPDRSCVFYLTLEDAYGSFPAVYQRLDARKPEDLIGKVFQVWGNAIDHEHPEYGIAAGFLERPQNSEPSLLLVPHSACASLAIDALHRMIDLVERMTHRQVSNYVNRVLGADHVYPYFFTAKAAPYSHHNFDGGLAVHSAECASTVAALPEKLFPCTLSRDLAIASAMLHDVGKIAWVTKEYVNPMVWHESRSILLAADALKRLREETNAPTAEMALYLLGKESHSDNGCCPEAMAVSMADRLSATRDGQMQAFARCTNRTMTASRTGDAFSKRYIRVVDPRDYVLPQPKREPPATNI